MSDQDRYPPPPGDPAQFAEWMRRMESRLDALEGAPQVGSQVTVTDEIRGLVMQLGALAAGGYGLDIRDADGVQLVAASTVTGLLRPRSIGLTQDATINRLTTSGTFSQAWLIWFPLIGSPGIQLQIPVLTDVGTTGELEITTNPPTSSDTDAYAFSTGGVAQIVQVNWLHEVPNGTTVVLVSVRSRRSVGAGNVRVFTPVAWHFDPDECSTAGVWSIV